MLILWERLAVSSCSAAATSFSKLTTIQKVAVSAYEATLAHHHWWFVHRTFLSRLSKPGALPTDLVFFQTICVDGSLDLARNIAKNVKKLTQNIPRKRFAPNCSLIFCLLFLVACYFDLSVRRLFGPSVRHILIISTFFCFYGLWSHSSCRNALVTLNTALAHTHAIGVAVYLAMFFIDLNYFILSSKKYIALVISLHSSIVFFSVG